MEYVVPSALQESVVIFFSSAAVPVQSFEEYNFAVVLEPDFV